MKENNIPIEFSPKKFNKKKCNKNYATDNEIKLSERLEMELTTASGNKDKDKGDLKSNKFLLESKQTKHQSLSFKRSWIEKIKQEAEDKSKYWCLYLGFTDKDNNIKEEGVMIPLQLFNKLKKILERDICDHG